MIDLNSLSPGDNHYRAYVGNPGNYDLIAATTFNLLTTLGLRQHHKLLDVGCGSLRNGRLLIPYLNPDRYYGIEPNKWLVEEGIENETGKDLVKIKKAKFSFSDNAEEAIAKGPFDFILLQSIFSHCGEDLLTNWVKSTNQLLSEDGIAVLTWVSGNKNSGEHGWVYPGLVRYERTYFESIFKSAGHLHIEQIHWPHPIQKWAIASKSRQKLTSLTSRNLVFAPNFAGK